MVNSGAYFNELDPFACGWLENLQSTGSIVPGFVDGRSIHDVTPEDVRAATQAHFFAGIGVWSHALRLAGWPDDAPVWTGSCPCQPFSVAGKGRGTSDPRHLWPEWFRIIRECRPPVVFGEQVASPAGRAWLDIVSADLEGVGYAFGAADLCAAGVGAPHLRQRLFFVAHRKEFGRRERRALRRWGDAGVHAEGCWQRSSDDGGSVLMGNQSGPRLQTWPRETSDVPERPQQPERPSSSGVLGDADGEGCGRDGRAAPEAQGEGHRERQATGHVADEFELAGYTRGFWADADWIICRDGKARPVEPGTFPLAHGRSGRVAVVRPGEQAGAEAQETHWYNRAGALKCIGNAIVPQVAAVFIEAALRSIHDEFV